MEFVRLTARLILLVSLLRRSLFVDPSLSIPFLSGPWLSLNPEAPRERAATTKVPKKGIEEVGSSQNQLAKTGQMVYDFTINPQI